MAIRIFFGKKKANGGKKSSRASGFPALDTQRFFISEVILSYRLTPREMEAVSGLPPHERFAHFVKRVADWEEVWGLRNAEGWVLSQSASGQIAAPFWPHAGYAENCAQGTWANCETTSIPLDQFIEKWLPGLAKDHRLVEVFPTANQLGQQVLPTELLQAITAECREAYGDDI